MTIPFRRSGRWTAGLHAADGLLTRPAALGRSGLWRRQLLAGIAGGCLAGALPLALAAPPVTPGQRGTAQQVAQAGVALSELAANAPERYTVQPGDTLWDISQLFLKSPWRWPELWGMNLQQIRNPHLIFPGQQLVLDTSSGRALLRMGAAGMPAMAPGRVQPRVRTQALEPQAISAVPLQTIAPFMTEVQVLSPAELARAPRIVAAQEGRVLLSRGELAYVRGDLQGVRDFTLLREAKPLKDPETGELLGHEATFVGTAEFVRAEGREGGLPVPATVLLTSARLEAGIGDRLAPVAARDYTAFVPHEPATALGGRVVAVQGEALAGGQNQVVTINRGERDGVERGHVLALWRAGALARDRTAARSGEPIRLPDEASGLLYVFRVFDRVSYALIVSSREPVRAGDRFSQP